jgi:hypothetical protein
MRRLRTVFLQDFAVLQPRYPSLPFFVYALFYGLAWDEFALAVRSNAGVAAEPPSLLLQHTLPKLSGVLKSSREALLQNSRQLVSQLKGQLQGIQGSLDAFLEGRVPVTFTSYFGAGPTPAPTPAPVPVPAPALTPINVSTVLSVGTNTGMPVITALTCVFTVPDV